MLKATKNKRNVKGKTLRNFSIFLIASFIFLILSKLSESYTETLEFDIKFSGLKDEITIVPDSNNRINAVVKSRGFSLFPYIFNGKRELIVDVDKEMNTIGNSYVWNASGNIYKFNQALGESFEVLSVKPDTLIFKYEKQTSKVVPILLKSNIEFASGYNVVDNFKLSKDSVKLVGSKKKIENIKHIETELLSLGNVKSDISENLKLVYPEGFDDIQMIPERITIDGTVTRFTEGVLEVPVLIKNLPKDISINYFPKSLSLSYYVSLDDYNSVTVDDFVIECDFKALKDGEKSYLVPVVTKKPQVVKSTRLKQTKVEFIIL